jgi:hypothetical protein
VEELRNKNMHFKDISDILALNVPEDVNEPLEVAVRGTDPQEVDLFARHTRIAISRGSKDQIVQNGCIRSDTNATANHDSHFELVPVLVATTERTLNPDFRRVLLVLFLIIKRLVKAERKKIIIRL